MNLMESTSLSERQSETELKQYQQYQRLLMVVETNQRRCEKRTYIFFVCLLLVFIAVLGLSLVFIDSSLVEELRSSNTSLMKNTDYLELVLPVLVAIAAAFIAFLGMNRLKDMDTQVDQMRSSISIELEKEINRVASLRSDLSDHIEAALNNKTTDFADTMTKRLEATSADGVGQVNTSTKDALEAIAASQKDIEKLMEDTKATITNFNKQYRWLLSDATTTRDIYLAEIATVYDVHQAVEAMWNQDERPDNIAELTKRYVSKVTEANGSLRGDENDYHNLAAECARHYLYALSCQVCEAGLKYFKKNVDLLSDWIQYGTKMGDLAEVINKPLADLLSIEKSQWNWRAFDFTVDFYLAADMLDKAEDLANEFLLYRPYEERAYYCLAAVYEKRYAKEDGVKKTISILKKALNTKINCPMCANKLADLLSDCGELEEALLAANRAIQELSQDQPSVNYGFTIYRRALIQDRMAYCIDIAKTEARQMAINAAIDYQVAISSRRLTQITLQQAKVRLQMLVTYFRITGEELGQYSM